ncbi:predicted protein [Lichtheimia corymbifera JMRC:FSU:9682]|uniref:Uncharacterized protein n=1 Tax=Lichtheimia corymbifera JMRC:FSU:9682 TaxID=1263082 RepID=A0A068SGQ4_9FUNG|nr:predicted protein [Lichtheimia corymbifera JMRC:FSU:9682]
MVIDDASIGAERSTSKSKSVSIDPVGYVQVLAFLHPSHGLFVMLPTEVLHLWVDKERIIKTWIAWHHGLVMEQTERRWTRPFGAEDKTLKDPEVNGACMLIPFALHMELDVLG